jgi:hypothetical protein
MLGIAAELAHNIPAIDLKYNIYKLVDGIESVVCLCCHIYRVDLLPDALAPVPEVVKYRPLVVGIAGSPAGARRIDRLRVDLG